ncbi:MAG: type III pantothenate kinase [Mangrovibacterium sp.]
MKRLIIDIGNTRCKWAIFANNAMLSVHSSTDLTVALLQQIFAETPDIAAVIVSSVRKFPNDCRSFLRGSTSYFIELTHQTPVPITTRYKTPETLGLDRLAAAIGAASLYPATPLLVVDAGTAITIDLVSDRNEYLGGNISPGIETRFKALNHFTEKLPLVELTNEFDLVGTDTQSAIRAGVQQGVLFEIDSYIALFRKEQPNLTSIVAGGHAPFLAKQLHETVVLHEHLTLYGLNRILEYNASK